MALFRSAVWWRYVMRNARIWCLVVVFMRIHMITCPICLYAYSNVSITHAITRLKYSSDINSTWQWTDARVRVPCWNISHPVTCLRLAWYAVLEKMQFWYMFQVGTVLSYFFFSLNLKYAYIYYRKTMKLTNAVRPYSWSSCTKYLCFRTLQVIYVFDMTNFARCQF